MCGWHTTFVEGGFWQVHVDAVDTGSGAVSSVDDLDASVGVDAFDDADVCERVIVEAAVAIAIDGGVPEDDVSGLGAASMDQTILAEVVVDREGSASGTVGASVEDVDPKAGIDAADPAGAIAAVS